MAAVQFSAAAAAANVVSVYACTGIDDWNLSGVFVVGAHIYAYRNCFSIFLVVHKRQQAAFMLRRMSSS